MEREGEGAKESKEVSIDQAITPRPHARSVLTIV